MIDMKHWLVRNARRVFEGGITPEICVLVGGGWWGVYATDKEAEIAVMDKLSSNPTSGVSPISVEDYNSYISQKKTTPGASPISPVLSASVQPPRQVAAAPPAEAPRQPGSTSEQSKDVLTEDSIKIESIEPSRRIATKSASKTTSKKTTDK